VKMRVRIYEITESQLTESGKGAKCSEAVTGSLTLV